MNTAGIEKRLEKVSAGKGSSDHEARQALRLLREDREYQTLLDQHEDVLGEMWARCQDPAMKDAAGNVLCSDEEDEIIDLLWREQQKAFRRLAERTGISAERLLATACPGRP